MLDVIVALAAYLILGVTFFYVIPKVAQDVCVFELHRLRDRLYEAARQYPAARDTLLYRDVEYVVCVMISHASEADYRTTFYDYSALRNKGQDRRASWRRDRHRQERASVFATPEGQEAYDEIGAVLNSLPFALMIRVIGGHPLMLLFSVLTFGVAWLYIFLKDTLGSDGRGPDPDQALSVVGRRSGAFRAA